MKLKRLAPLLGALVLLLQTTSTSARLQLGAVQEKGEAKACQAEDLKHRVQLQNKIAGWCTDMCKAVGAYPACVGCPKEITMGEGPAEPVDFDGLLEHMDNLRRWGKDQIVQWHKLAGQ
jgi:hypothetical protein